jgi:hypothetical protein
VRHQLIPPFTVEAKMTAEVAETTTNQGQTAATLQIRCEISLIIISHLNYGLT